MSAEESRSCEEWASLFRAVGAELDRDYWEGFGIGLSWNGAGLDIKQRCKKR